MAPTQFAPAERASADRVEQQRQELAANPVVRQLLEGMPEAAAVLNQQRQILLANSELVGLSAKPANELIGLRPGEALSCVHAADGPGGCGTGPACRLCGAVTAILAEIDTHVKQMRDARFVATAAHGDASLDLRVTAAPISGHEDYILLSIRDISDEKRRLVLERLFYHDLLNAAGGLDGLLQLMAQTQGDEAEELRKLAADVSAELVEAIKAGRDLAAAERGELQPSFKPIVVRTLLQTIAGGFSRHEVAQGKEIRVVSEDDCGIVSSDEGLLARVLGNLLKNALEAIRPGQAATLSFSSIPAPTFRVHNPGHMPESVRLQIFQRSFSTKASSGRGIGTYSVKLLTERYLNGSVTFRSSAEDGTEFEVTLPLPQAPG